jgi:MFS transporter, PAT family, beta-lactamase induction signal transducer AmpG
MQDVAVDGLAVDILPADEFARGNGFFYGGQVLGISLAGGAGGYLIAYHGLPTALLALAAVTAVILVAIVIVRERPGERLLPWTRGIATQRNLDLHLGAFGPIIRGVLTAMFQRQALLVLGGFFFAGAVSGLTVAIGPVYSVQILGWEKNVYSGWASQSNLVAGILGLILFGFIAERWGAGRLFIVSMFSMTALALAMLLLQPLWANGLILIGFIFTSRSLHTLRSVASGTLGMAHCAPAIAASQFTLFMACINFGNMSAAASLGWLDSLGGIPAMFTAMAVCGLIAAAFAFAAKVGR